MIGPSTRRFARVVLAAALAAPLPALADGGVWNTITNLPWYAKLGIAVIVIIAAAAFIKELIITMAIEAVRGLVASFTRVLLRSEDKTGLGPNPTIVFQPAPPRPPTEDEKQRELLNRLRDLRDRDPHFSVVRFQEMAAAAFLRLHEARALKDPAPVISLISPAILEGLDRQIRELKRLNRSYHTETLEVDSAEIADYAHDGPYDYLTVHIRAAGARYTQDDRTGEIVDGSRDSAPISEKWTFLRRDTVKTPQGGDQPRISKCPACGAPLAVNAVGRCDYCDSEVTTGAFTWVLAEQ